MPKTTETKAAAPPPEKPADTSRAATLKRAEVIRARIRKHVAEAAKAVKP
jgi:hypothetical protein